MKQGIEKIQKSLAWAEEWLKESKQVLDESKKIRKETKDNLTSFDANQE